MKLSNERQTFLEDNFFKGKIVDRFTGRGGLIYKIEQNCIPKFIAYKTTQEFEVADLSNVKIEFIQSIEREFGNWLRYSNHPLLIKPFSVNIINGFPMVCMPFCNGDISYFIRSRLSFTGVICFSIQIIKGMIEAKKAGLEFHQDIKPENILYIDLSDNFRNFPSNGVDSSLRYSLRIADFGVANAYFDGHLGGTNVYKSPEQYDDTIFDGQFNPDVYSVGLIIAELFQGYHPAAKDEEDNIRKMRGGELKRWALAGERNFKYTDNEYEMKLVDWVGKMLSPDPRLRPSFELCYDFLFDLLKEIDPLSLKQLSALLDHYDEISVVNSTETKLFNLMKLSKIESERSSIITDISFDLQLLINASSYDPQSIVYIFQYAKALYNICNSNHLTSCNTLIASAFELIVKFVLDNQQEITSSLLRPVMKNHKPIGSDFEASAEVFNDSLKILLKLDSSGEIHSIVHSSRNETIKAFLVYGDAQALKHSGHHLDAYHKLCELRSLIPISSTFEEVFSSWEKQVEFFKKLDEILKNDNN